MPHGMKSKNGSTFLLKLKMPAKGSGAEMLSHMMKSVTFSTDGFPNSLVSGAALADLRDLVRYIARDDRKVARRFGD
jgi:hypothetical protein